MRTRPMIVILAVTAIVVAPFAYGGLIPHLLYGKRIAGKVVDAETGRPIAGAHVAFLWRSGIIPHGFTGHNSRNICYHAAATKTDVNGTFQIAEWKEWSTYDVVPVGPTVLVYMDGYKPLQWLTQRNSERGPIEHLDERYALTRFNGSVEERLDSLFYGLANQSCDYGGISQKSLFPMLKAIYEEAKHIARTPNNATTLYSFATQAAYAALALDPDGPAREADVKAFISENLK